MKTTIQIIVILIVLLLFPIGLNYVLNLDIGATVVGKAKDWLTFWATYISGISSFAMVYLTYKIIKQNDASREAYIVIDIVFYKSSFMLRITNCGQSIASNIKINIQGDILEKIHPLSKYSLCQFNGRPFILLPNNSKFVLIESAIVGEHEAYNPEEGKMERYKTDKSYLKEINKASIKLQGKYETIGKVKMIEYCFSINDFDLSFAKVQSTIDEELPKITKAINSIK
ncbi:MAG: hypothetical protein ROM03_07015 [Mucispirillum sp.]|nr:hypothetical protein [Mucispirillum sp.]